VTRNGVALALVFGALAAAGAAAGAKTHMLRMSGRKDLSGVKGCTTCHFVSTSRLAWSKKRPHHAAPAGLVPSPDGARLYVALDDTDEVAVVDVASRRVTAKARVAGAPTGIALDSGGERLFVTCRGGDRLAVLQARTLAETGSIPVGVGPIGVAHVATPAGERLVVANAVSDDVSVVSISPLAEVARLSAGREPYAVAAAPGSRAFVVSRMAGIARGDEVPASEVTVVDAASARVSLRARLESAHLSEGIALVPRRPWALASIVRVRNLVPITQVAQGWVMSSGLALCDAESGKSVEIPLDETNAYYADPSGVAVDAGGRRAYVASGGGDVVTVVDLDRLGRWLEGADETARRDAIDDLQLSPEFVLARVPTGRNPRQVVLSPDGKTLFVAERLDDSILLVDTESLRPVGRVALGDGGEKDPIRRGERVFARARTTFQAQFSCRSCHPDARGDGLAYDFDIDGVGRDIVENRSLQGLDGTAPFKWNGKNPSLKVQCGPRFAKVLTRASPFAGPDLDDLDAFLTSLPPTRTGHETHGRLTEAQERGRRIFFATRTTDGRPIPYSARCSTCHRPPLYTDGLPADVDTKGPFDSTGKLDVPHLLGVAASAPYLHDGRAATLEEIWTIYNPKDTHGITNYMTKHQLNDLIEFLKTL
jgi:YVTN family beta-propeller protein